MTLAKFIRENKDEITHEWVKYARENIGRTDIMENSEVTDHIRQMLNRIVADMESSQTDAEQEEKSKGNKNLGAGDGKAASDHGEQRLKFGFDFMQLSSEFRALRASVLRLWSHKSREENWKIDFHDMVRFNEAIDEVWMISLHRFQEKLDESKNLFLGILGHDLRNPLATVTGAHSLLKISQNLSEREKEVLRYSDSSLKRMNFLINNLLELTELRLGGGMPIDKKEVDLAKHAQKIVHELQLAYAHADIQLKTEEALEGKWDPLRLAQMMANLITNAIRYGRDDFPVKVNLASEEDKAIFSVHNEGEPISKEMMDKIYEEGYRLDSGKTSREKGYGLGLFIVKEIVDGHQGEIEVSSSEEKGTTFKVILPRN